MKKHPTLWGLLCLLVIPSFLWAQTNNDELKPVTRTYALTQATVVTEPGKMIEGATVVVKDGLILAVGKNVKIPIDAQVVKADSMYIYAGFIEGLSHTGIPKAEAQQGGRGGRGGGGPQAPQVKDPGSPPNDLAGITPEKNLAESLKPNDKSISDMRKLGFTAANVVPSGQMLPGQGALILLHGDNADKMILKDQTSFFSQLTGARRMYPATVIAVIAKWRELYRQAELAQAHEEAYKKSPSGMSRPSYDPVLQAFYPIINKEQSVFFKASDVKSAYRVLSLQKEFDLPIVMAELKQGWHVADELSKRKIPVLLSMDLPEDKNSKGGKKGGKKGDKKKEESQKDDPFKAERAALEKRKMKAMKEHWTQAGTMEKAGINFGFSTLDVKSKDVKANLRKMIENGLSEDAALAALTTTPAKMLGVSDMLGSVATGKIANLVVTDQPYFDEKSNVRYVFVEGNKFEFAVKKPSKKGDPNAKVAVAGKWTYSFEAMGQNMDGILELVDNDGDISGSITNTAMGNKSTIETAELDGNALSFSVKIDGGGQTVTIEYNLIIEGDNIEGTVSAGQFGTFDLEGERIGTPDK
ncbi:MAG: amidohydrolase family protein [Saprospiraceae bacterium]|nr:amidohydrolase family protein [Saprospiraceae bacterium]